MSPRVCLVALARIALVVCLGTGIARAQDAGADASTAPVRDARIANVASLMAGTLEVGVEPSSLFDAPLDDEEAIAIDRVRIATLLRAVDDVADASTKRMPPAVASTRADIARLDAVQWDARVALDRARLAFYDLPPARRHELLAEHAARVLAAKPKETEEARKRPRGRRRSRARPRRGA